jgi:hypothetical protein
MMMASVVVAAALGFMGDGYMLNESPREARSAHLLAQSDVPYRAPAGSISELDNRIQLLNNSRRGLGGSITGIVFGSLLVTPGVILFVSGLVTASAIVVFVGGGVLAGAILLIVLCANGIASSNRHNNQIDEEVRVLQDQRDRLLSRPVSMEQWAPVPALTVASF